MIINKQQYKGKSKIKETFDIPVTANREDGLRKQSYFCNIIIYRQQTSENKNYS